jgi:2'-5' RNA ligase
MRLFLAFPASGDVKDHLAAAQAQLRALPLAARFPEASEWHLTVLFLGEQTPAFVGTVRRAVDGLWPDFRPTPLLFDHFEQWPRAGPPRLVVVRAQSDPEPYRRLAAALRTALLTPGPDWVAHMTLARVKATTRGQIPPLRAPFRWTPETLVLFRSTLTPSGPVYEPLATWRRLPKTEQRPTKPG